MMCIDLCMLLFIAFLEITSVSSATVRLSNGSSPMEGRVEVLANKRWLTVCDDYWDVNDAIVVCRTLGLNTIGVTAFSGAYFGQGNGTILGNEIHCTGKEEHFMNCRFDNWRETCSHTEDAGVRCGPAIRLAGGSTPREGRVEVKFDDQWSTVCDDQWDNKDAKVVCRALGFNSESATAYVGAYFDRGSGVVALSEVDCEGSESHLLDCPFMSLHKCDHSQDAGVRCQAGSWCVLDDSGTTCVLLLAVCPAIPALLALRIAMCFWKPNNRRMGPFFIRQYRPILNAIETKFDSINLWCACVWHYILCCCCNFDYRVRRMRTGSEFAINREG